MKVSIILTTYNRASLLSGAIKSVRRQSFADWELIVCDDASTDVTARVVKQWQQKDGRILYIRSSENGGIAQNSNRGLRQARGEYVAIIDDDDRWTDTEKLRKEVAFLDTHRDYVGVGGGVIVVDDSGRELFRYLKPETDAAIRQLMLYDNPMANSTALFRRAAAAAIGDYDQSLRYAADRDFWLKLGTRGKLHNLPEYFIAYLMADQNTSIVKMRAHLRSSLIVMRRYRRDYPHYFTALIFNWLQYLYAFLPPAVRRLFHLNLARLKRLAFR